MKTLTRILSVIFALAFLGALGGGGYFALKAIVKQSAHLDPQLAAVIIIASMVTLLVVIIIASSIRRVGARRQAQRLHMNQAATYQLFVDLWEILLRHGYPSDEQSAAKLSAEIKQLECWLAIYGSPAVVKAHAKLCTLERKNGAQHPEVRTQFAKAVMEIRKELRADTRSLTTAELERLFWSEDDVADANRINVSAKEKAYQGISTRTSLSSNS